MRGVISWDKPKTDGFIRTCLDLVGVHTRGQDLSSAQLLAIAQRNGLPFVDSAAAGEDSNRR